MKWKSSKYFFVLIAILVLVVIGYRYKQYIIDKNYMLEVNTTCNSEFEKCFDPNTDWSFDETPYKRVIINAQYAPVCLEEHNCENFSCPIDLEESGKCEVIYCSDDTKLEGEECLI